MSEDLEKEITKLERYLRRQKDAQFIIDLRQLNPDELKERMKQQALYRQETITARQRDEELKRAKEKSRDLAAPYNESVRMNDKISRFISLLLEESGEG